VVGKGWVSNLGYLPAVLAVVTLFVIGQDVYSLEIPFSYDSSQLDYPISQNHPTPNSDHLESINRVYSIVGNFINIIEQKMPNASVSFVLVFGFFVLAFGFIFLECEKIKYDYHTLISFCAIFLLVSSTFVVPLEISLSYYGVAYATSANSSVGNFEPTIIKNDTQTSNQGTPVISHVTTPDNGTIGVPDSTFLNVTNSNSTSLISNSTTTNSTTTNSTLAIINSTINTGNSTTSILPDIIDIVPSDYPILLNSTNSTMIFANATITSNSTLINLIPNNSTQVLSNATNSTLSTNSTQPYLPPDDSQASSPVQLEDQNVTAHGDAHVIYEDTSNSTIVVLGGEQGYLEAASLNSSSISEVTISAWVKPNYSKGSPEFTVVSRADSFSLSIHNLIAPTKVAKFSIFDGIKWISIFSKSEISDTSWTHITAAFNRTSVSLYINGTLEGSEQIAGIPYIARNGQVLLKPINNVTSSSDIVIGASIDPRALDNPYNFFSGLINGVLFVDSALQDWEIAQMYDVNIPQEVPTQIEILQPQPVVDLQIENYTKAILEQNNTENYIVITNQTATQNISRLTLSAWIKPDYDISDTELTVLSKENSFSLSVYNIVSPKQKAVLSVFDGIRWHTISGHDKIPNGNWTHLAAVIDGTSASLYQNGTKIESIIMDNVFSISSGVLGAVPFSLAENEADIVIGAYVSTSRGSIDASKKFGGQLDKVQIYKEALGDAEIYDLFIKGNPNFVEQQVPVVNEINLEHDQIEIGRPVTWTQNVVLSNETAVLLVEVPSDAIIFNDTNAQVIDVSPDTVILNDTATQIIISEEMNATDVPVVSLDLVSELVQEEKPTRLIMINDTGSNYTLTFETPAPYTVEEEHSTDLIYNKTVTVAHNSTLHYTNVKSYSDIPEELASQGIQFSLFWNINGTKTDVTSDPRFEVTFVDTNGNGIIDRMEWTVPQLSEQEFEIVANIVIINVKSFPVVGGDWTVRFTTTGTADLIISGIDGTTFGQDLPADLKFLELNNGTHTLTPEISGNSIIYRKYSSTAEGFERSLVLTPGEHHLQFRFGNDIESAHNLANGKIAFDTSRDGDSQVYTMNPDGALQTRITATNGQTPSWSPNGTKIAFILTSGSEEVYTINADGTGLTRLTNNGDTERTPKWSPNSTKIMFTRNLGTEQIFTINTDGTQEARITNNAFNDASPVWSPNNTKIAFSTDRDGNYEIYTMRSDGTLPQRLTNNAVDDSQPTWSPNGTKIVFATSRDGNFEIYVMNSDGTGQTRLTTNSADDFSPVWSPDGSKIAFSSMRDGNLEIYTMNPDGSSQTRITNNAATDDNPSWAIVAPPIVANLTATKQLNLSTTSNTPEKGSTFNYTITVTNNGPHNATNVFVMDRLPSQLTYVGANLSCAHSNGNVTCPIGTLNNGTSAAIQLRVTASSTFTGTISNYVRVNSTNNDFKFVIGSNGSGNGQFFFPAAIAINSTGYIFVADTDNNRIQILDPNKNFVKSFGSFGFSDGQFVFPEGIAINSTGHVFVADSGNGRIQIFDRGGVHKKTFGSSGTGSGQFSFPEGVAINSTGHVFIADTGNHRVQIFDKGGSFLSKFGKNGGNGSSGSGNGEFSSAHGITVTDNRIYVADMMNHRVQVFDLSGNFVFKFGKSGEVAGKGAGEFNRTTTVAVDSTKGRIFVGDRENHRVQIFDLSGNFLYKFGRNGGAGTSGSGIGEFFLTHNMILNSGLLYVADAENGRIQAFSIPDNDFTLQSTIVQSSADLQITKQLNLATTPANPQAGSTFNYTITITNNGPDTAANVKVIDTLPSQVTFVAANATCTNASGTITCNLGTIPVGTKKIELRVTVNTGVTGTITNIVEANSTTFDPILNGTKFVKKFGGFGITNGAFQSPQGIHVNSTGHIFVADLSNHRVQIFDKGGVFKAKFGTGPGSADGNFNFPTDVTTNSTGHIFVTDSVNRRVQIFDASGNFKAKFGSSGTGDGQFMSPEGIFTNSTGHIFVVDRGNHRVQIFDKGGVFKDKFGTLGSGNGQFSSPYGIATNSTHIFVVDSSNHRVQIFDASGNFTAKFGTSGSGNGQFSVPKGISLNSEGNILVADFGNYRIQIFDKSGNFIAKFGTGPSGADGNFNLPFDVVANSTNHLIVSEQDNHRIQIFKLGNIASLSTTLAANSTQSLTDKLGIRDTVTTTVIPAKADLQITKQLNLATTSANPLPGSTFNYTITVTNNGPNTAADVKVTDTLPSQVTFVAANATCTNSSGIVTCNLGNVPIGTKKIELRVTLSGAASGAITNAVEANSTTSDPMASGAKFLSKFGISTRTPFDLPKDMAINGTGHIFVADTNNHRVQIFDPSGNLLKTIGSLGSGDGQFENPQTIFINSTGHVIVGDPNNFRIQIFDKGGVFKAKFSSNPAAGLAANSTGHIFVTDPVNDRIEIFDASGNLLQTFGSEGSANGQFDNPEGIFINSTHILVVDPLNNRIQIFDQGGIFKALFSVSGNSRGVSANSTGHIFVSSVDNNVQIFDASGNLLQTFGSSGTGNGQFSGPFGIKTNSTGHIFVADTSNNRIQIFDKGGTFKSKIEPSLLDGELSGPLRVAVNGTGHIFVADSNNHRIQIFDKGGVFKAKFGSLGGGNGQFISPSSIVTNSTGHIFVADHGNNRVQIFTPSGNFITSFGSFGSANGQFNAPRGISTNSTGHIFVADNNNHRIQIFDKGGVFKAKFGSLGSANGQLSFPHGITVNSTGHIFVADTSNHRIQIFNPSGNFLTKFGSFGSANGQFNNVEDLSVNATDHIIVVDEHNDRIQIFDPSGNFKGKMGTTGSGNGQFDATFGIAANKTGHIFVADYNNNRIQVLVLGNIADLSTTLASSGTQTATEKLGIMDVVTTTFIPKPDLKITKQLNLATTPAHPAAGSTFNYTITVTNNSPTTANDVKVIDKLPSQVAFVAANASCTTSSGTVTCDLGNMGIGTKKIELRVTVNSGATGIITNIVQANSATSVPINEAAFISKFGSFGTSNGQFDNLRGIYVNSTGHIFVADTDNNRVQIFDPSGNFKAKFGTPGSGNGQLSLPRGIYTNSTGHIFVADTSNNRVQIFDPSGNFKAKFGSGGTGNGQFSGPRGLATNSTGHIFVTDTVNDRIQIFDASGNFMTKFGALGSGNGQFNDPRSIHINSTNHIFVTDTINNRIEIFDHAGIFKTKFGVSGASNGQFDFPKGITTNSTGHIFVADTSNHRIQIFDPSGNFKATFGSSGSGNGQFNGPWGIYVNSTGHIFVTDINNSRVQIFTLGTIASLSTTLAANSTQSLTEKLGVMDSLSTTTPQTSADLKITKQLNLATTTITPTPGSTFNYTITVTNKGPQTATNVNVTDTLPSQVTFVAANSTCTSSSGIITCNLGNVAIGTKKIELRVTINGAATGTLVNTVSVNSTSFDVTPENAMFVSKFGSPGIGDGQLNNPFHLSVNNTGHIFVADFNNNRVQIFDASGNFKAKFGTFGSGDGQLSIPADVISNSTHIIVADQGNHRVQIFDASGNFRAKFGSSGSGDGQFNNPRGIAINSTHIFVADTGQDRIQIFDKSGNFKAKFGSFGSSNGQFFDPYDLALNSTGHIFVTDSLNNRIQIFDPSGNFKAKFGSFGTGNGQFNFPAGIAIDNANNVYVADDTNRNVQVFDKGGTFLFKFGSSGTADGQFGQIEGVAVNGTGHVFTSDFEDRIQIFKVRDSNFMLATQLAIDKADLKITKQINPATISGQPAPGSTFNYTLTVTNNGPNTAANVKVTDTLPSQTTFVAANATCTNSSGIITCSLGNMPVGIKKIELRITVNGGASGNITNTVLANSTTLDTMPEIAKVVHKFGTIVNGDRVLTEPADVAVNATGHIFVVDTENNRIQVYDASGNFVSKFGSFGSANGQFHVPIAVEINGTGHIFILDTANSRIQIFDKGGNFLKSFGSSGSANGQFNSPNGFTINSTNHIIVADSGNDRIQIFDKGGVFKAKFGSFGTSNGQFNFAEGVVTNGTGHIFVADTGNDRIQIFDASGNFKTAFGSFGSGNGEFFSPIDININSTNHIFVADSENDRIQIFDKGGNFLATFGMIGSGNGQFINPQGIEINGTNHILIADTINHRIQIFDKGGVFKSKIGPFGAADGEFNHPHWIATNATGHIFVADQYNHRIQIFDKGGNFKAKFGSFGTAEGSNLFYPFAITADPFGRILVTQGTSPPIKVFDLSGDFLFGIGSFSNGAGGFASITSVAVNNTGHIFALDSSFNRTSVFDKNGNFKFSFGTTGSGNGQFANPYGIAINATGHVFITDSNNNRTQIFDHDGNFKAKFGSSGTGNGQFNFPEGIAVDPAGNIYVADNKNNRVQVFDASGNFKLKFGSAGTGMGQFDTIHGLAVNATGYAFATDLGNNRIQVLGFGNIANLTNSLSQQFSQPLTEKLGINDTVTTTYIPMRADLKITKRLNLATTSANPLPSSTFNYTLTVTNNGPDTATDVKVTDTLPSQATFVAANASCTTSFGTVTCNLGNMGLVTKKIEMRVTVNPGATGNLTNVAEVSSTTFDPILNGTRFINKFGTLVGSPFDDPHDVAVNGTGHIFVADTLNNRIKVFDASGNFKFAFGSLGTGNGQFDTPVGIAINSTNHIFVAEESNARIQIFDKGGNFKAIFGSTGSGNGQFDEIEDIFVNSTGHIFVTDAGGSGNHRVQIFTSSGNFLKSFGSFGSTDGKFNYPTGIFVNSTGNIFVVDTLNHRIQIFDASGNFLAKFGSSGSGNGQFASPEGISVNSTGHIIVVDTGHQRVQIFDPSGNFKSTFGSGGSGSGQFSFPRGIFVNSTNHIFIADVDNNRIQIFDKGGTFKSKIGPGTFDGELYRPNGITINGTGHVFVADRNNHRIQIFDKDGIFLAKFGSPGFGNGQFDFPEDVFTNSTGHIFVADTSNHRIQIFSPSGNFLKSFGAFGSGNGQFNSVEGIYVNSTGHIFVTDTNNHRIQIFTPSGNFLKSFGAFGSGNGQFNTPVGIVINSTGHIFVADNSNHRVQIFDKGGSFLAMFGSSGTGNGQFNFPLEIAVDARNIYVTDSENDRVQIFDLSGNFKTKFGSSGTGNDQFITPDGIAINSTSHIFVADSDNHRIQVFTIGNVDTLSTPLAQQFTQHIPENLGIRDDITKSTTKQVSENLGINVTNHNILTATSISLAEKLGISETVTTRIVFLTLTERLGIKDDSQPTANPTGPSINSLVAADPQGDDGIYNTGDTITVTFSAATNRPPVATKANLDALFTFSQNLGTNYVGTWTSPSVLTITIINAAGATPPAVGVLTFTVKASGNLRNAAETSQVSTAVSPLLSGSFGDKAGPSITSLIAADPDSGDAVYGNGDTLRVAFSTNTNQPPVATKADLDAIFTFSQNLGTNYVGTWTSPSVLTITIINAAGATPPAIGILTFTVKASGNLRDSTGTSLPSTAVSPALSGTFGTKEGPSIVTLIADDPANDDAIFNAGDTITVKFSEATNQPPVATRANLDTLFLYSQVLGTDYTGEFIDPATLVITIVNPTGATPPSIGTLQLTVRTSANLKNAAGTSLASSSVSPVLTGTFGTRDGPEIVSIDASDPDSGDAVYGNNDLIKVTFSVATNRPPVATKADLDALFTFSQNLGTNYIGTWSSPSILIITILDSTGATPPAIGTLTLIVKAAANLKDQFESTLVSTDTSPPLAGSFGNKAGPTIISLVASDPDSSDAVFSTGDTLTIRFSESTNQPPVNSKSALINLFTFSQGIGDDYSGVWQNPRTLVITILDAGFDVPPQIGVLTLTVKESGNLKDAAGTSLASTSTSPALTGTFGTRPGPSITAIVAADPPGADAVFGNRDTITVRFSEPTNQPAVATKANLDNAFTFSQNLGSNYTGVWLDPRTLEITIRNAAGATPPAVGTLRITVNAAANLKNAAGTSLVSTDTSPPLSGTFGTRAGPSILTLVAEDPGADDAIYNLNDTLTVKFSEPTNQPAVATKANLDNVFTFSQNLGTNYTGVWINAETLVITIRNAAGATPPAVGTLTLTVKGAANLNNAAETSLASTAVSPPLAGSFGSRAGPSIVSFIADDPDNSDSIFSTGDTLTLRFDEATNQPPVGSRAAIDNLFVFSQNIGDNYAGTWTLSNTLVITILDATTDEPPVVGELVATVQFGGNLKNAAETSLASVSTSTPLDGTFGTFTEIIPVDSGATAVSELPSGLIAELTLPAGNSGTITISRTTGIDVLNATSTVAFLGTVIDIAPSGGADCTAGCGVSFRFTRQDAAAQGLDPFEVKIYHDESDDGDFGDANEILVTVITQLDTDLFRATATVNSNSKFAIGGVKALAVAFTAATSTGGLGGSTPSLGSLSFSATISDGFGGILGTLKPTEKEIGPADVTEQTSTSSRTTVARVGEKITLQFNLYEDEGINNVEHVEIGMNNKGDENIPSDTILTFDKYKFDSLQITDPHKLISKANFVILEKDAYNLILKFEITFAKSMATSDVRMLVWDLDKNFVEKSYEDALKIETKPILQKPQQKQPEQVSTVVPGWIKMNAGWWSEGQIQDSDFVKGIQYLIRQDIIKIPAHEKEETGQQATKIPSWIKTNAGWWSEGQISEMDFVRGLQYLINHGIIQV
jgi:uncharacterized repeat protein (TIGR01451 family)